MSKKKSLGSSPIGYKPNRESKMSFIPDLGDGKPKEDGKGISVASDDDEANKKATQTSQSKGKKSKKIVSYSLEIDLISKVKAIASEKEIYYSSLVSMALKNWIESNT